MNDEGVRATFADLPRYSDCVLVDGAFDPLHAGHLAYLQAALDLGKGPLLCAVASDDQIREKGKVPFLPGEQRVALVNALHTVTFAYLKDRPTHEVIEQMRPTAYVKGADWMGKIPPEQVDVCARYDIPILIVETPKESSTARLKAWALADADQSLEQLEAWIASHAETPFHDFNREYFQGNWRAIPYTLDDRRRAEGKHPELIGECFSGLDVLDVGCGPGYLVELLKERGMRVGGIDPSKDAIALSNDKCPVLHGDVSELPDKMCDVAICREVLEHLPVEQVANMVSDLFRVARQYVYITTRFSQGSVFGVTDERDVDPTHQTLLSQPFLRAMCVLCGGRRNLEIETTLDHQQKGRVLVYEVH